MKIIKTYIVFTGQFLKLYFSSLKRLSSKEDCFWSLNATIFTGKGSKKARDSFDRKFDVLLKKTKKTLLSQYK